MQIRTATADDSDTFAELNRHVHGLHLENAPASFREPTHEEAAEAFLTLLSKENVRAYLAFVDGTAVAYMLAFIREREAHAFCPARRLIYVEQISVEPQWQNHGIGHALLDVARQLARDNDIDTIETDTWAFNIQAQAFFEFMGFEPKTQRYRMKIS